MEVNFHVDEVFEMAIQMEVSGAKFYKEAADSAGDKEIKSFLMQLSAMEVEHKSIFKKLRSDVVGAAEQKSFYDPQGEGARYLKSIADTQVFFQREFDLTSLEEVLKEAIWAEKDTAVFYMGIRDAMNDEETKQKIDTIIDEEKSHIMLLNEKLKELRRSL